MPVNEVLMATGDWSVTLRDDTPWRITDLCDPETVGFATLVVTPLRLDPAAATVARIWSSSMFAGVLRRQTGRRVLSGPGFVWWAGDESGGGDWEWTWTGAAVTFTAAVNALSARYFAVFGVSVPFRAWAVPGATPAGTRSPNSTSGTLRQKLEYLCALWDLGEWRSDLAGGLQFGTQAALYGSAPAALLGPISDGVEQGLRGIRAQLGVAKHLEQYATAVGVEAGGAATYATLTTPYRNVIGDLARVTRRVSSPQTAAGDLASAAASELNLVDTFAWLVDVTTDSFAPADTVRCGADVWLTDEGQGLTGLAADRMLWRGEMLVPVRARCVAHQWPIEDGMGVYVLWQTGTSSVTVVDLSDWVEWEPPGSRMTVGMPDLDLATVVAQRQTRI